MNTFKFTLISALLVVGVSQAHAVPSDRLYTITATEFGTLQPAYKAVSKVPFNKSYGQLNEYQKNMVRKKFDNIGLNDTPPYPVNGSGSIYQPLLKAGSRLNESGLLKIQASINTQGEVIKVEIESSPSERLTRRATRIVQRTKFDAAQCAGVNCEMQFPIELQFN